MVRDIFTIVNDFLSSALGSALLIIIGAYVVLFFATLLAERIIRQTVQKGKFKTKGDAQQREKTLIGTLKRTIRVLVTLAALFMILSEFGFNIGPLLAGAGVAGVALGFGAQTMVKDYLAGFFIIAENQYRVGDVLQVNRDVSGVVEHVTLRMTVLRDLEGMVHHIPNGTIEIATNMTMDYAQVDLNLRVSYDSDIDQVEKVINSVGNKLATDEEWKDVILEAPAMARVNDFTDSAIVIKILCKTVPMQQWAVKGEMLRRIKTAFEKENIIIPYPQYTILQTSAKS